MGCYAPIPYQRASRLSVMDIVFSIGINTGLMVLLAIALISAKEQVKAGRKATS